MIDVEVRRPPLGVEDLRADWDRLYRTVGREPSISYEWSRAILRNHLAGRDDWFVLVLRRAGTVVGIVPMMFRRERLLGRDVTTLQPIQEKSNTHSELLLAEVTPEVIGAWFDAIARLKGEWDLLRLSRLLENSVVRQALATELARRGHSYRWRLEPPSFHLSLPSSYPDYLNGRSGKLRNYLKRAEKKLAVEGQVEFSRVEPSAEFGRCYDELLSIERDSWKHDHGTAISAQAHQEGFFRDLVEGAMQSGMLHLTFLRLNGVAIAYNLGLVAEGYYSYVKTSYRHEYRPHGAASIGRSRLIEMLIGERCAELDFPGEPFEWEQQWTDEVRWHYSLLVCNRTWRGLALALGLRGRDLLRPPKEDRTIVFCDPRTRLAGGGAD